jgi:superfamily II DNA or RNA helicase
MRESTGRDLFIVDNSVSGWTGLKYLEEWTQIARAFDIATGCFEIGGLLMLDGKWQGLDKIRILMGSDTTHRTHKALLDAVRRKALEVLDTSLMTAKDGDPFLRGVPAILQALASGQIECRVYDKAKFHAKAYITHAKRELEVVGSQALVGSSNFTAPGLTRNIELNVQVQSAREVAQLQEWFETHWADGKEITPDVISTIERHTRLYSPFDVYGKALQEYFKGHELTATEWDETKSRMFPRIDRYQQEAYWALMKIARQHTGAFLCDGVGLGKTFVGLMLIERLILHEGKRVVLLAPKPAKEAVWEPHLRELLPHIGGVGGAADFSNLAVFSHTDLGRKGDFPERFRRVSELADVVIVDEAHHFRNPGRKGNGARSRYHHLYELLESTRRPKQLFMLTATPINNRLSDFRHMAELFTRRDDAYFARTLGVNNLRGHFAQMEKTLREKVGHDVNDVSEHMAETQEVLAGDSIFRHLVVQRSRSYARESQLRETGQSAVFPERRPPQVAEYSLRKTHGRLLDMFENAFTRQNPLFTLAMYYPLGWYKGADTTIDPFEQNRQRQIVGLIRTNFLKRFESSVAAFELSCDRLLQKLIAFLEVNSTTDIELRKLARWKNDNADILGYARARQMDMWGEELEDFDDEDIVPPEMLEGLEPLDRDDYEVAAMLSESYRDLDQIIHFLTEARQFQPKDDDKLQKLIRLLESKDLASNKVLIFTEFADTARYLRRELETAQISGVAQVDSGTKGNRADVIRRFAPYYNGSSSAQLTADGLDEIRVLISTDVLSEGLNLQDAARLINYDIHWNPVRLMQRIGRVDRRMNPDTERRIVADHPELAAKRGKVSFWNFLPPDELNRILSLFTKVTQKTLLISRTFGIEGKQLLAPSDDFEALKEFSHAYEGTRTAVETMHLEYQELLKADPELEGRLRRLPGGVRSGRTQAHGGFRGVFFCYALPALDKVSGEFTEDAGTTRWYVFDASRGHIVEDAGEIVGSIRSDLGTPRKCDATEESLLEVRAKIEKHIKNSYLKRIDAPVGVKPLLKCWMELNEE